MKTGIFAIGYVKNIKTYIEDLQKLLIGTIQKVEKIEIDNSANKNRVEYYNVAGYPQFPDGKKVDETTAKYVRFKTPYKTNGGESIWGWFSKPRPDSNFIGIEWGTDKDFRHKIESDKRFNIGKIYFEEYQDGLEFLDDIATNTIPEAWKYKMKASVINHPILKSYIENVLERLIKEAEAGKKEKLVYSEDKKYVMFNTNLLDKFFHEVIIFGEYKNEDGEMRICNPKRSKGENERRKLKFKKDTLPKQPQFFDDINEVVFQTEWKIDDDFDTFTHIIEERRERFPIEYKNFSTDELARKLDDAIEFAVALAQRNYKFIVPMYRPQIDSIQLLMPIYLSGTYNEQPDFALVLTPEKESEMYCPETILPLDAVYQNARLIAKPDELWLNPDLIK